MYTWPLFWVVGLAVVAGCGGKLSDDDSGASDDGRFVDESGGDADVQPDLDSDADTDADADADADADTDTDTDEDSAPPTNTDETSYADVYADVFFPHCSACHSGASPAGGLDFSEEAASHAALLDGYVVPGDAAASPLYERMTRDAGQVGVMPPSGPIGAAWLEIVGNWIDLGALE